MHTDDKGLALSPKLGILGGMGPMATADFLYKLVDRTPAQFDHEHIPTIVHSVPQLPDRMQAIFDGGPSPLPKLLEAIETLQAAGAVCIAMPCNTAHYWYDEFAAVAKVPFLHIADTALAAIDSKQLAGARLGLLGTRGTLKSGFYQRRFAAREVDCLIATPEEQALFVDPAIMAVKANDLARATPLIERAAERLLERGASSVVLGCTEIPVVLKRFQPALAARCVDVTVALADACIVWWQAHAIVANRTHV
jgi:aspartate racemase